MKKFPITSWPVSSSFITVFHNWNWFAAERKARAKNKYEKKNHRQPHHNGIRKNHLNEQFFRPSILTGYALTFINRRFDLMRHHIGLCTEKIWAKNTPVAALQSKSWLLRQRLQNFRRFTSRVRENLKVSEAESESFSVKHRSRTHR